MMNKIIIIDDDIKRVIEFFGRIYKMLWKGKDEEGTAAEVIFFGDYWKREKSDADLTQENIDNFSREIKHLLSSHCEDEEQWESDGDMYRKKKKLIDHFVKNIPINSDDISELVDIWSKNENLEEKNNLNVEKFRPLIDMILKSDKSGEETEKNEIYILLDVILLFNDIKQVESGMPIISMGLYNALKKEGYTCYLYSSFVYDYLLIDKCREIYKECYDEEITIYPSKDFFSENINSEKCLFYHLNK